MIAVVVLTYRADPALFDACVASVVASGDADRVVIVDNGRTVARDRIDSIVQGAGGDPSTVQLVVSDDNLGYAGGMNAGITCALDAGADAVAILNDDAVVEPGWLRHMAPVLAAPRVGAVQPKILLAADPGGTGPTVPTLQSVGMSVRYDGAGIDVAYGEPDRGQHAAGPIALFTGAAVLLGADLLREVGGFDERYFLYYEDIDLAQRAADAGWQFAFEPSAVVHHAMSSTTRTVPGLHRYWQERNRLWWLVRHGTARQVLLGLGLSLGRLAKHPSGPQVRAIRDGLRGARWCRSERRSGRLLVQPVPRPAPRPWAVR